MLSNSFHSLVAKLSHSSSSNTCVNATRTSSIRVKSRYVELHRVGQSPTNFFPHKVINFSVALVDLFTFLPLYVLPSALSWNSLLHQIDGLQVAEYARNNSIV